MLYKCTHLQYSPPVNSDIKLTGVGVVCVGRGGEGDHCIS